MIGAITLPVSKEPTVEEDIRMLSLYSSILCSLLDPKTAATWFHSPLLTSALVCIAKEPEDTIALTVAVVDRAVNSWRPRVIPKCLDLAPAVVSSPRR